MIMHTDPGHGWLQVSLAKVRDLGIADKISSYSYISRDSVYLEEDCDLEVFAKALIGDGQFDWDKIPMVHHDLDAPCRNFERYSMLRLGDLLRRDGYKKPETQRKLG